MCLALASCDRISPSADGASAHGASSATGRLADCAIGSGAGWRQDCSVDQQGDILTFRHADGGFRRFHILQDGRGLMAADGAEPATVSIVGKGLIEIGAGDDRYRVPATIATVAQP